MPRQHPPVPVAFAVALVLGLTLLLAAGPAAAASRAKIDGLMWKLTRESSAPAAQRELTELGDEAIPRLVEHLEGPDRTNRMLALSCLRFVWSPAAEAPVTALLDSHDAPARRFALALLKRHLPEDQLVALLEPLARDKRAIVAAQPFDVLERTQPSLDRLRLQIPRPRMRAVVAEALPRYYSPELTPDTMRLLARANPRDAALAWAALTEQCAADKSVRHRAAVRVRSGPSSLTDRCAEYLRYHGTADELPALREALTRNPDAWARASLEAAIIAIEHRASRYSEPGEPLAAPWPDAPADAYALAIRLLRETPTQANHAAATELLRSAEPMAPFHRYGTTDGDSDAAKKRAEQAALRGALAALVVGIDPFADAKAPQPPPPACTVLVAPVRDYFDPERTSFGHFVTALDGGPFENSFHIGDDVAWRQPHATVIAIGPGTVVHARSHGEGFGGLVVIRHTRPDGSRFHSLYGHLGPVLDVQTGQTVAGGQRVGSLGRSWTHENGGYRAHLHFSIHTRDTTELDWVAGYVSVEDWRQHDHDWVDPQAFIRGYSPTE